jgi:rhodanese-related sulfurtransferase
MNFLKTSLAAALLLSATVGFAQQAAAPAAAASAAEWKYKSKHLSRAEIDALLAKPDTVVFVDVRRPDEVSKIGGFPVYLSIQAKDLEKNLAYIPKDRWIVAVSNHAGRGGAAADLLSSKGFKVAGAAGSQDYEAQGGTIVKIVPPAPAASAAR